MRNIEVSFEQDLSLDIIDVLIRAPERNEEVNSILRCISKKQPVILTLTGTDGATNKIVEDDVISVSVMNKQVEIKTEDSSFTMRDTLQNIENKLNPAIFVRISRYEIINLNKIIKYDFTLSGTLRLELANGIETWASRRCIPLIRKRLNERSDVL